MASERSNAEALAYYLKNPEIRSLADDLFKSMDKNGDGTISKTEFLRIVKKSKPMSKWMEHDNMFADLDTDNSGELDFDEFVTLVHKFITWSVCDGCGKEIVQGTTRLSCAKCFKKGRRPFDLCSSCHSEKKYEHKHKDFEEMGPLVIESVRRIKKVKKHLSTASKVGEVAGHAAFLCTIM